MLVDLQSALEQGWAGRHFALVPEQPGMLLRLVADPLRGALTRPRCWADVPCGRPPWPSQGLGLGSTVRAAD